jgi:hypothetical protein
MTQFNPERPTTLHRMFHRRHIDHLLCSRNVTNHNARSVSRFDPEKQHNIQGALLIWSYSLQKGNWLVGEFSGLGQLLWGGAMGNWYLRPRIFRDFRESEVSQKGTVTKQRVLKTLAQ